MHLPSSARYQKAPQHQPDERPHDRERNKWNNNDCRRNADPDLESDLLEAQEGGHKEGRKQCKGEAEDAHHGTQDCRKSQRLAQHHQPPVTAAAKFVLKLHAPSRVRRVVVPTDVVELLPTYPTPIRLALASHVVATRHLLCRKATAGARLRSVHAGIRQLLLHDDPLICRTSLGAFLMGVAVVVAEAAIAVLAAHVRNNVAVLGGRGRAEPAAARAAAELRVGVHAHKPVELLADVLGEPGVQLLLSGTGLASVVA
mmetsp:Transcript_175260/g.562107  ORF Transcript_175260/g.562107 Transcript_175260/m.562107 type:complete len:257 (-) Transcript_175260:719-1489(-)